MKQLESFCFDLMRFSLEFTLTEREAELPVVTTTSTAGSSEASNSRFLPAFVQKIKQHLKWSPHKPQAFLKLTH